jgi:hypothetical protein
MHLNAGTPPVAEPTEPDLILGLYVDVILLKELITAIVLSSDTETQRRVRRVLEIMEQKSTGAQRTLEGAALLDQTMKMRLQELRTRFNFT